eukprot:gene28043-31145_t
MFSLTFFILVSCSLISVHADDEIIPKLSEERVVFEIEEGIIEFAFWPEVAPKNAAHVFELATLGLYTGTKIFRVDKGFVAQTNGVSERTVPLNDAQKAIAYKNVPLEVVPNVRHHEGVLSMARANDPNSGGSSIFFCYGSAPHLDMQYSAFGKVTKGMDVLHKLEKLPTTKEGIFVMPIKKIMILNSYWYRAHGPMHLSFQVPSDDKECSQQLTEISDRFISQEEELAVVRKNCSSISIHVAAEAAKKEIIPRLSAERVVLQIEEGIIEFAFWPEVAPKTTAHIFEVAALGLYTGTKIFRVDKGFVAQTHAVAKRTIPMNAAQKAIAYNTLPLEVVPDVLHHEGVLSMARTDDPNSGESSIFFCYGSSPHLDMHYTAFGKNIVILNSYWYRAHVPMHLSFQVPSDDKECSKQLTEISDRFISQEQELVIMRKECT